MGALRAPGSALARALRPPLPRDRPAGGGGRPRRCEAGDLEALGDAMNVNHGLLAALGVSSSALDGAVDALRGRGRSGPSSPGPAATAAR